MVFESVNVPAPALVKPPEPEPMTPEMVVSPVPFTVSKLAPLLTEPLKVAPALLLLVIVPAPFKVMFLAELKLVPVIVKVPAFNARPALVPRLPSAATLITPPLILVRPL